MKRLSALLAALGLAACGGLPWSADRDETYWIKPDAPHPGSRVESLLAYADYARGLAGAESSREHEKLRLAFAAGTRNDFVRLQYALLLIAAPGGGREIWRARQLLEPLLKEPGHEADLRLLAAQLNAILGDLQDAERRYRDEQQRANELDQKVEALKSIERRILQRSQGGKTR